MAHPWTSYGIVNALNFINREGTLQRESWQVHRKTERVPCHPNDFSVTKHNYAKTSWLANEASLMPAFLSSTGLMK
jgi:hypothetical protein